MPTDLVLILSTQWGKAIRTYMIQKLGNKLKSNEILGMHMWEVSFIEVSGSCSQ